jgi:hypothetical protein
MTDGTSSTTDGTSSTTDGTSSTTDETPSTTDEKLGVAAQVPAVELIKLKTLLGRVKRVVEMGWKKEKVPPLTSGVGKDGS